MQRPRSRTPDGLPYSKVTRKSPTQPQPLYLVEGEDKWPEMPHSKRKRNLNEPSSSFQQPDRSTPNSLLDSSLSANGYRTLRHKYLLLEEESCQLGKELSEVEAEVKTLEDQKHTLLDKLVVLEGLMDPSELQPQPDL